MDDSRDIVQIESRLRAVDAVGDVVQALWAIARAQLPRAQAAVAQSADFLTCVDQTLERIVEPNPTSTERPLFLVVVGPERPFCGALPRELLSVLRARRSSIIGAGLIGQRLVEAAQGARELDGLVRFRLQGASSVDELEATGRALAEAVLAHARDEHVQLLHARGAPPAAKTVTLLPGDRRVRLYLPDHFCPADALVAAAVRESVGARVQVALAEALHAEVRARVAAAEAARQAIDRRRDHLREAWRVLRHEQITSELNEIFAGRMAVTRARSRP